MFVSGDYIVPYYNGARTDKPPCITILCLSVMDL